MGGGNDQSGFSVAVHFLQALSLALFGRQGSSTVYCVFTTCGEVNRQLHVCWPTWPFGCFG